MKKYLLFIISMLCTSIGAWADIPDGAVAIGSNGSYFLKSSPNSSLYIASASDISGSTSIANNMMWAQKFDEGDKVTVTVAEGVDLTGKTHDDWYYFFDSEKSITVDLTSLNKTNADAFKGWDYAWGSTQVKSVIVPSCYADDVETYAQAIHAAVNNNSSTNFYGIDGNTVNAYIYSDSNNDIANMISESTTTLNISGTDIGQNCINAINGASTSSVGISGKTKQELTNISIESNNITSLDFSDIDLSGKDIDLTKCTNLGTINLTDAKVDDINLSGLEHLTNVNLTGAAISGKVNVENTTLDNLTIQSDADMSSTIVPYDSDVASHVKQPSNDPVEVTVARPVTAESVQAAIYALGEDMPEGATPKNVNILHVTGTLTEDDIHYIKDLPKLELLDISACTYGTDISGKIGTTISSDFSSVAAANKPVVIIPTPSGSDDPTTGSADEIALQAGTITYAYYTDANKKNMDAWCPNQEIVLANLKPVVDNTMTLRFLPIYGNDGVTDGNSEYMLMYAKEGDAATYLTSANVLGQLPFASIDFTWVYYGDHFCNYSNLNSETHYIIAQQNGTDSKYDFTSEAETSPYKYNDNIWVVSTYKGSASPYATRSYYDGRALITSPYTSDNLDGFEANGTTANITYIRTAGKLSGAANYVSDLQKTADRTVIVGNVATSDITAVNIMRNKVLDLSGAVLQEGASLSTLSNSYIEYLALPYNSNLDVASFKASQCTNLKGAGKFVDTTDDPKHLYLQSYQEGGMVTIMSCLAKATGITSITAAGEMNARDLTNNVNVFDANGHFIFSETDNGYGLGKDYALVAQGNDGVKINGASVNGALSGRTSGAWVNVDLSGVKLHQYTSKPENSLAKFYDDDKTYQDDLHMSSLGFISTNSTSSLVTLKLPTDKSVWRIPTGSFTDAGFALKELCIPGQYREIGSKAFANVNSIERITTTLVDSNGNGTGNVHEEFAGSYRGVAGGMTVTLPEKLEKIETYAFANVKRFTDVYVTSEEVPVCEINSFDSQSLYGYGGCDFTKATDSYHANRQCYGTEEAGHAFAVLHWTQTYPLEEVKKLTDITRQYLKMDDSGKVDDRGNPLYWPTQSQYNRSYALATNGYLDGAIKATTDDNIPTLDSNGTDNVYSVEPTSTKTTIDPLYEANGSPSDQTYTDYIGWHQFTLVGSWSYAEKYEMRPWNTINIPYDVTFDQLKEFFGVTKPASANNKKIIVNSEGYPIKNSGLAGVDATTGELATTAADLLPTLSTLTHVKQAINYTEGRATDGMVTLMFSEDLAEKSKNETVYNWSITAEKPEGQAFSGNYVVNTDNKIMLADHPYHIKPFVPLGAGDIRVYINNELKSAGVTASATNAPAEWKVDAILSETGTGKDNLKTNVVQDFQYQFKGNYTPITYDDKGMHCAYVPKYSYFLWVPVTGESLWYRYEPSWGDWKSPLPQYSAIIFKDNGNGDPAYDLLVTEEGSLAPRFGIAFGGDIDDETTGISELNNESRTNVMNGRVYNMRGEVVSESGSTAGLAKGIYIINGKKVAIK